MFLSYCSQKSSLESEDCVLQKNVDIFEKKIISNEKIFRKKISTFFKSAQNELESHSGCEKTRTSEYYAFLTAVNTRFLIFVRFPSSELQDENAEKL